MSNIYQAALTLRTTYADAGIELGATDHQYTNLYFIMHDALHTYLGCPPVEEYEPQVLSTEMLLGGVDHTVLGVDADVLEIMIECNIQG